MAVLEHVEVKIISSSTGQQLKEYDDPEPETIAEDEETGSEEIKKYIEAESGEEFKIQVTLKKGFCYHGADGILIRVHIDGDALSRQYWRLRPSYVSASTRLPTDIVEFVSSTNVKRGEEWCQMNFGFGEVIVNEDLHFDAMALHEKMRKLGSIHVKVRRATSTALVKPKAYESAKVITSSELDKKLVVKSISHTFKPGKQQIIEEPRAYEYAWNAIQGRHSAAIEYNFFYRSYRALQYLGCIPTTPEPLPLSERPPTDMTDEEKVRQIIELRAETNAQRDEIQQLTKANETLVKEMGETRDLNIKITTLQAALANIGTIPTPSSNMPTVKRERVKQEPVEESETSSRPAKRAKPEYVTLDD
ncbi:hypothetical protein MMC27_003140 [Xylographa pallens]|nr:hypothetical protein [Xylographa pallens]